MRYCDASFPPFSCFVPWNQEHVTLCLLPSLSITRTLSFVDLDWSELHPEKLTVLPPQLPSMPLRTVHCNPTPCYPIPTRSLSRHSLSHPALLFPYFASDLYLYHAHWTTHDTSSHRSWHHNTSHHITSPHQLTWSPSPAISLSETVLHSALWRYSAVRWIALNWIALKCVTSLLRLDGASTHTAFIPIHQPAALSGPNSSPLLCPSIVSGIREEKRAEIAASHRFAISCSAAWPQLNLSCCLVVISTPLHATSHYSMRRDTALD